MHRIFFTPTVKKLIFKSSAILATTSTSLFSLSSQTKGTTPIHYEKMKTSRSKWDTNPKTTILGRMDKLAAEKILERAKEVKEIYKDSHYVFIHAQSTCFLPIIYLINSVAQLKGTPKATFFKPIRKLDPDPLYNIGLEKVIMKIQLGNINDHHPKAREIMISADADFDHYEEGESASAFLKENRSVMMEPKDLDLIVNHIISDLKMSNEKKNRVREHIGQLCQSVQDSTSCGNLFVFCIPKQVYHKSLNYKSHPLGQICDCHPGQDIKILEQLQNTGGDSNTLCNPINDSDVYEYTHYTKPSPPQYRLIVPNMKPEAGVLSFMLTPLTKLERKQLKVTIKELLTQEDNQIREIISQRASFC